MLTGGLPTTTTKSPSADLPSTPIPLTFTSPLPPTNRPFLPRPQAQNLIPYSASTTKFALNFLLHCTASCVFCCRSCFVLNLQMCWKKGHSCSVRRNAAAFVSSNNAAVSGRTATYGKLHEDYDCVWRGLQSSFLASSPVMSWGGHERGGKELLRIFQHRNVRPSQKAQRNLKPRSIWLSDSYLHNYFNFAPKLAVRHPLPH